MFTAGVLILTIHRGELDARQVTQVNSCRLGRYNLPVHYNAEGVISQLGPLFRELLQLIGSNKRLNLGNMLPPPAQTPNKQTGNRCDVFISRLQQAIILAKT